MWCSITALRDLNMSMDRSATAIPPIIFLQVLHMAFPRFAEKGEGGGYVQQVSWLLLSWWEMCWNRDTGKRLREEHPYKKSVVLWCVGKLFEQQQWIEKHFPFFPWWPMECLKQLGRERGSVHHLYTMKCLKQLGRRCVCAYHRYTMKRLKQLGRGWVPLHHLYTMKHNVNDSRLQTVRLFWHFELCQKYVYSIWSCSGVFSISACFHGQFFRNGIIVY